MHSITRRSFIGAGLAAAATPVMGADRSEAEGLRQGGPAIVAGLPDVAVIGSGAFGAWTALCLRERGAKVTLIDAYGPGHARATSCDEVRQIRHGYGDREIYSRSALRAMTLWKRRQDEFGRKLLFPTGRLEMRREWTKEFEAQKQVFEKLSIPYEVLKPQEMAARYPQVNFEGVGIGFLDTNAGLLKAREAIIAVAEMFERKGGTFRLGRALPGAAQGRVLQDIALGPQGQLAAGAFVFACGPWLRQIFPTLLGKLLSTGRTEIAYIGSPAGDPSYRAGVLPNLSERGTIPGYPDESCYTQSDIDAGLKIARGGDRVSMDLDRDERVVSARQINRVYEYVRLRFPALSKQPIVATRVCQGDGSADGHFVIDRHPDYDNLWIAGGGSGHGFKHGPVVGEYIADRLSGVATDPVLTTTFGLAGRSTRRSGTQA
jgi:sarcosine oxidase